MEKLEVLPSFKKRFAEKIKSSIQSIKYCQSTDKSVVEIKFANSNTVKSIDLKFMGGEIIKNEDGSDKDILPLFNPDADIVDNASRLLQLDDYSLIICLNEILNPELIHQIVALQNKKTQL